VNCDLLANNAPLAASPEGVKALMPFDVFQLVEAIKDTALEVVNQEIASLAQLGYALGFQKFSLRR
jgi:hypothetical protein